MVQIHRLLSIASQNITKDPATSACLVLDIPLEFVHTKTGGPCSFQRPSAGALYPLKTLAISSLEFFSFSSFLKYFWRVPQASVSSVALASADMNLPTLHCAHQEVLLLCSIWQKTTLSFRKLKGQFSHTQLSSRANICTPKVFFSIFNFFLISKPTLFLFHDTDDPAALSPWLSASYLGFMYPAGRTWDSSETRTWDSWRLMQLHSLGLPLD